MLSAPLELENWGHEEELSGGQLGGTHAPQDLTLVPGELHASPIFAIIARHSSSPYAMKKVMKNGIAQPDT